MLGATLIITVMYVTFILSYTELACAMPKAGGAFVYAQRALGSFPGFLAGLVQIIEFVFAPPAIAKPLSETERDVPELAWYASAGSMCWERMNQRGAYAPIGSMAA